MNRMTYKFLQTNVSLGMSVSTSLKGTNTFKDDDQENL